MEYKELPQIQKIEREHFYYVTKRYLIDKILEKFSKKNLQILDLGCGTGWELEILSNYGQVIGLDGSKTAIKICSKRNFKKLILYEIKKKLPFKGESFDLICAFDLLEHLQYDGLIVKEINRVLKKGGYCLFTVPAYQFLFSSHDRSLNHLRRYSRAEILQLFDIFQIIKLSYFNMLLFLIALPLRLISKNKKTMIKSNLYIKTPNFINKILIYLLKAEDKLICQYSLPFGLSIIGLVRKKE